MTIVPARSKKTVLVVDDNDMVRALTRTMLESAGYDVIAAEGVTAALASACAHGGIDVLMTDLVMPDGDGFEVATRLSNLYPSLSVLYTSGYADMGWTGSFLAKPYSHSELVDALKPLESPATTGPGSQSVKPTVDRHSRTSSSTAAWRGSETRFPSKSAR